MGDDALTAAFPVTAAAAVEDREAARGEIAVCEGLRPSWAKPEVTATPANAIPKTQPSDVRIFIYPHELLMVLNCHASAHNIRRPALPLYSAQRRSMVTDLNLSHADRYGQEWSQSSGRDGRG